MSANSPWEIAGRICKVNCYAVAIFAPILMFIALFAGGTKNMTEGTVVALSLAIICYCYTTALAFYCLYAFFSWLTKQDLTATQTCMHLVSISNSMQKTHTSNKEQVSCSSCKTFVSLESVQRGEGGYVDGKFLCEYCMQNENPDSKRYK